MRDVFFITFIGMMSIQMSTSQRKPPNYSLDAMPVTDFDCQDKIVGGYYADPQTECQMFHVCTDISGVVTYTCVRLYPGDAPNDPEPGITNKFCACAEVNRDADSRSAGVDRDGPISATTTRRQRLIDNTPRKSQKSGERGTMRWNPHLHGIIFHDRSGTKHESRRNDVPSALNLHREFCSCRLPLRAVALISSRSEDLH
ncbi:unnamed protein product [Bemisia tabaci]|uniref:Uncharacterized protein n=1 Tax=Bemisia tabaci TaxID=7038 RepID=A0AAI8UUQ0_BEMTA|nr:unnamed protein product [Bemisia tabaci]